MEKLGAPVQKGDKRVDLALTRDDGLRVPVEVKNQTELTVAGDGNSAVEKFKAVAAKAGTDKISHFEIIAHTDSRLPRGYRVDAKGWLEEGTAGLDGEVWTPTVIGGKRVRVVRGPLGRISID